MFLLEHFVNMEKLTKWLFILVHFQIALSSSSDELNSSTSVLKRLDSIEVELRSEKDDITSIKMGMKKLNERVQLLETKDENILEDLDNLNGKVNKVAVSVLSSTSETSNPNLQSKKYHTRITRSVTADSSKHAASVCSGAGGGQLCTFYYPDHPDTPQLEIGHDEMTTMALGENGAGPANCEDLQSLGYTLKGFYTVRVNKKRMKYIYCEFNHIFQEVTPSTTTTTTSKPVELRPVTEVLPLEIGNDEMTKTAARENGTGPANCQDLQKIGYTLKGFYTVRVNEKRMKNIFCEFIPTTTQKEAIANVISTTSKPIFELKNIISVNYVYHKGYLLRNKHGKCLAVEKTGKEAPTDNGAKVIQTDCDPTDNGQLWRKKSSHLCNDWNKCLSIPFNSTGKATEIFQWDSIENQPQHQQWAFIMSGLLLCKGHCLSFPGDASQSGVRAITDYCNENAKGQVWTYLWY